MTNEEAAKVLKLEQDSLRENPKVKVDQRLYDAFDAAIEVLEARWTPISERLPKTFEYVYCTCHSLIDDREDWVVETVYIPQPSDSPYSDWGNIPMLNLCGCVVTAWMHRDIPKPYKLESEDKNADSD